VLSKTFYEISAEFGYFVYSGFLCFLFIVGLITLYVNNFYIIGEYLAQTKFSLLCKIFLLLFTFMGLVISKAKFMVEKDFLIDLPLCFSFLLLFMFFLVSGSNLFIIYMAIEGVSMVIYTLGAILHVSFLNLEAVLKYFIINNFASAMFI
jgi:NADH:ubiquinone oxidoreductase subunit 2 (subunit N)